MKVERRIIPLNEFLGLMASAKDRFEVELEGMTGLDCSEFDIEANEFIQFAEKDLEEGTEQGLVNALSNAKRAIDCQIDTVLGCFGLRSRRNFPEKIKVLSELGIVTPRIVKKVIRARNYLEHEFVKPERDQVEDAVDVANLFIAILDKAMRNFWSHFCINALAEAPDKDGSEYANKWLHIEYENDKKHYKLYGAIFSKPPNPDIPEIPLTTEAFIKPKEKGFFELAKLSFSLDKPISESEIKKQAVQFVQLFSSPSS
jgi:hypothetical protein